MPEAVGEAWQLHGRLAPGIMASLIGRAVSAERLLGYR